MVQESKSSLSPVVAALSPSSPPAVRPLVTRHGTLRFERHTLIMGILNVTPDSFYDGGRRLERGKAIAGGVALAQAGADIVDIGGESTQPGAKPVPAEEEMERVLPVIRAIRREVDVPISVDTYKAEVARAALDAGADIVNDISALRFDSEMISVTAAEGVPVVLMHMRGTPQTMQIEPHYDDVVRDVKDFLIERLQEALSRGVEPGQIVLDPGIGFGKTLDHNLALVRGLPELASIGQPVLVGASRKGFIGKILGVEADERLEGSLAAAVAAALAGAHIIRTHDVKETRAALRVADALRFGVAA